MCGAEIRVEAWDVGSFSGNVEAPGIRYLKAFMNAQVVEK